MHEAAHDRRADRELISKLGSIRIEEAIGMDDDSISLVIMVKSDLGGARQRQLGWWQRRHPVTDRAKLFPAGWEIVVVIASQWAKPVWRRRQVTVKCEQQAQTNLVLVDRGYPQPQSLDLGRQLTCAAICPHGWLRCTSTKEMRPPNGRRSTGSTT